MVAGEQSVLPTCLSPSSLETQKLLRAKTPTTFMHWPSHALSSEVQWVQLKDLEITESWSGIDPGIEAAGLHCTACLITYQHVPLEYTAF